MCNTHTEYPPTQIAGLCTRTTHTHNIHIKNIYTHKKKYNNITHPHPHTC
jgi:hypothetical protein